MAKKYKSNGDTFFELDCLECPLCRADDYDGTLEEAEVLWSPTNNADSCPPNVYPSGLECQCPECLYIFTVDKLYHATLSD